MNIGELHIDKLYIGGLQVDKVYLGETLVYGGGEPEPIEVKALKFEARTPGQVLKTAFRIADRNLEYSYNGTTWTNWESGYEIPFPSNNIIYLRGMNNGLSTSGSNTGITSIGDCDCNVSGNIMYLLDYTQDLTAVGMNAFNSLFKNCKSMTFDGLSLPATSTNNFSYANMFMGCTSLTTAPTLPSLVVGNGCYSHMFDGCTSLITAPELPSTQIYSNCYEYMFYNCKSLINAPRLDGTYISGAAYQRMFAGCSSLVVAPELPAGAFSYNCYYEMFAGCSKLKKAPTLNAANLQSGCYRRMFNGCSELNEITIRATDISANNCLDNWVSGVSSTGTFKCIQGVEYPTGNSGIPNGWTVEYV